MRLGVYHPWTYLRGGAERVIVELTRRSSYDWTLFTHHFDGAATFPEMRSVDVVELRPRVSVRRSLAPLLAAAATIGASRLPTPDISGLLVSSEGLGDFILARNRLPAACFCHTPLKIVHDPVTRARVEMGSRARARTLAFVAPAFTAVDRRLWRRYRHVFANSRAVRERIERAGLAPDVTVEVLHPGVDVQRFDAAGTPPTRRARTFVVPGRIMWQKNVELAIDAFVLARQRGLDAELVVVGALDAKSEPYLDELRQRAGDAPVRFESNVSDRRMAELLRSCLAAVHPAPSEDFGITPLEAMAAGAPVIAVDAGGVRETVVHGHTGWLLPPDAGRFADQLLSVAEAPDLVAMRASSRERAASFTWGPFVARIDEVMERVVAGLPVHAP